MKPLATASLLTGLLAAAAQANVVVAFDEPSPVTIAPGQAFSLTVGLGQAFDSGIASFGVKLAFDPTRVALAGSPVTVTPEMNHNFSDGPADVTVGSGSISVIGIAAVNESGFEPYLGLNLAEFHFQDLGIEGEPYEIMLRDIDANTQWASPAFDELDSQISYGPTMVVVTPEPSSAIVLIGGLSLLLRRRTH